MITDIHLTAALIKAIPDDALKAAPCHCNNCLVQMVENGLQASLTRCVYVDALVKAVGTGDYFRLSTATWRQRAQALADIGAINVEATA